MIKLVSKSIFNFLFEREREKGYVFHEEIILIENLHNIELTHKATNSLCVSDLERYRNIVILLTRNIIHITVMPELFMVV